MQKRFLLLIALGFILMAPASRSLSSEKRPNRTPAIALNAPQESGDPTFLENVLRARQEIVAFDKSNNHSAQDNPRRKWADYFWSYFEAHPDSPDAARAAERSLKLLTELKAYSEIIKKSRTIDPQNDAWAMGAIQAVSDASNALGEFHDFFEMAEGLIGITLNAKVRDATRLVLADNYFKQGYYDKADPLLRAIVAQSADSRILRAAKKRLLPLPSLQKGDLVSARDSWQLPEQVISSLGIKPGWAIAEVGAADGYFTFHLANAVGARGKIFSVESDLTKIARLNDESKKRALSNIHVLQQTNGNPHVPKSAIQVILVVNAYHALKDRLIVLTYLKAALKRSGALVIIDEVPPFAEDTYLGEDKIVEELTRAGFKLARKETFLPAQFMLVFHK